jgi:hypothetical protein
MTFCSLLSSLLSTVFYLFDSLVNSPGNSYATC